MQSGVKKIVKQLRSSSRNNRWDIYSKGLKDQAIIKVKHEAFVKQSNRYGTMGSNYIEKAGKGEVDKKLSYSKGKHNKIYPSYVLLNNLGFTKLGYKK